MGGGIEEVGEGDEEEGVGGDEGLGEDEEAVDGVGGEEGLGDEVEEGAEEDDDD